MFSPDIVSLRQFYATPLGHAARAMIASALADLWPACEGDTVVGVGYAPPYVEAYLAQATPLALAMPARQGAVYWPAQGKNLAFLSHEDELPLQDNSVNRVLLAHCVEHSESLSALMDEVWRVLTPGGRVLAIVPTRRGAWSHSPRSPFGYGRPFSKPQLRALFSEHQFTPTRAASALFTPPTRSRFLWRLSPKIEAVGRWIPGFAGGVLLMEAEKQLYAAIQQPVEVRGMRKLAVSAARPVMGRSSSESATR